MYCHTNRIIRTVNKALFIILYIRAIKLDLSWMKDFIIRIYKYVKIMVIKDIEKYITSLFL